MAIGAVVYFAAFRSTPERVMCTRVAKLCGADGKMKDLDACVADMEKVSDKVGSKRFKKTAQCVDKAGSCPEAAGCLAGTGVSIIHELLGEFLKGFGKTIFGDKAKK